jgi:hypothetical protein
VLNPLADNAYAGETVILLYVHPPAPFLDVAGVVNAVQNMLVQDYSILPIGTAQGFKANDGSVFVGAAFVVPDQSGSDDQGTVLYDDLLSPISYVNVVASDYVGPTGISGGAVLAFVDYGNNLNDAIAVAQQAQQACNAADAAGSTALIGGTPYYVTALDSIGALTPYAQSHWAAIVGAAQVENTTTGKVANTAEDIANTGKNVAAEIATTVVVVVLGLLLLDRFILKSALG